MDLTNLIDQLMALGAQYGLHLIYALSILVVGRWIAKGIAGLTGRMMDRAQVDSTLRRFVTSLTYIALLAFVVIAALNQLGIQTASFVAVIGAAGLAIGLALQGALANFAAGVLMIIFKPFKAGDYIEGAGTSGTVEEVQIFTTQLLTPDNKAVIIPNAKLMGDNITNFTLKGSRRVDMTFGIGYEDDINMARSLILDIVAADERIFENPPPEVLVSELADSSVNLATRVWVNADHYWDVLFTVTEAVKKRFDAEGISIPFPQRDIHMYQH
jgi:small conductance mechanosensitive channel